MFHLSVYEGEEIWERLEGLYIVRLFYIDLLVLVLSDLEHMKSKKLGKLRNNSKRVLLSTLINEYVDCCD